MTLKPTPTLFSKAVPSVSRVSPQVNKNAQVKYKSNNTSTSIYGTGVNYPTHQQP